VDLKPAFSKLKASPGKAILHYFFCEASESGMPILLMGNKKVPPKDYKVILETAKKKGKSLGRMEFNAANELIVTPIGSFPSSLARGIQVAAREVGAMVFSDVVINPSEPEDGATDDPGVVEAPPPPSASKGNDESVRFLARLKKMMPEVLETQKANAVVAQEVKQQISEAQVFVRQKDFAQANALLDRVQVLVKSPPADGAKIQPKTDASRKQNPGLAVWTLARTKVVDKLKLYAKSVAAAQIPEHTKIQIRLLSVAKQLTAAPTTEKEVSELERYLAEDEVVHLCEEFPGDNYKIRATLLAALKQVRKYLSQN
jgi:hypothetical protein